MMMYCKSLMALNRTHVFVCFFVSLFLPGLFERSPFFKTKYFFVIFSSKTPSFLAVVVLWFNAVVNSYGHVETVGYHNHTFPGQAYLSG